jgi:NAD(P)-dependent dehydrogenase (short-subunit alcohol dehydrogenase family)
MATAIITGASRGLGRALTADLARDGWRLFVDARHDRDLRVAVGPLGGLVFPVPGDVTDASHRQALVAAAGRRLDLLVLNASALGQSPLPSLADYDLGRLRAAFEVNAVAALGLVQAALPALRAAGGRVVFVTSDAAVEAYEGWGGYGASKAALEAVSRVLAVEEPGLRVYAADPGDLRTDMHQQAFPGEDISDRPEPESVVPAFRRLVDGDLPSGRYRAADLAVARA